MEFTYCGPYPRVEIELASRLLIVDHGEKFAVSADEAVGLLDQPANYEPCDPKVAEVAAKKREAAAEAARLAADGEPVTAPDVPNTDTEGA